MRSLDCYFSSINQSVSSDRTQRMSHGSATGNYYSDQTMAYGQAEQVINYSHQQDQQRTGVLLQLTIGSKI